MKFLTVVLDLDSRAIVFTVRGNGADALNPFWKRLAGSKARIEAVGADMSPACALAVRQQLPRAVLVTDRIHVIKLSNDRLTNLLREFSRKTATQLDKDVLQGPRGLLPKRVDNLDDSRGEPAKLLQALELSQSLAAAFSLRDDLNPLWEQSSTASSERFLNAWIRDAERSGIRLLQRFARTLASRRQNLQAWSTAPISTGPLEAVNNKIKLLNRQAFGYRNGEFFQLKLFALHHTRYA